ncbi:MAG: hypothetical protein NTAFB09_04790 [Nitrosospira sp.]
MVVRYNFVGVGGDIILQKLLTVRMGFRGLKFNRGLKEFQKEVSVAGKVAELDFMGQKPCCYHGYLFGGAFCGIIAGYDKVCIRDGWRRVFPREGHRGRLSRRHT